MIDQETRVTVPSQPFTMSRPFPIRQLLTRTKLTSDLRLMLPKMSTICSHILPLQTTHVGSPSLNDTQTLTTPGNVHMLANTQTFIYSDTINQSSGQVSHQHAAAAFTHSRPSVNIHNSVAQGFTCKCSHSINIKCSC